ncbi:flagellar motor switch protein [Erythrobacter sp. NAP1]|uniref:flagellar motor switch protein FliN n=1 Tax=Erythrobacter sp. NAP1 TaxID=237727 RepID=UPI00006876DE|nr:flagellar motor switch protein FliN [Erythrobacter sp. NAP1]EAQ28901.1 flagellar motor switch protein [Erythrobacter sp. NAP1]
MNALNPALKRFGDVTVRLSVELGRTEMPLKDVLAIDEGSVVPLNRLTDELLDVTANGRVVARGEVIAQDGRFALRIVELVGDPSAEEPIPAALGDRPVDPPA